MLSHSIIFFSEDSNFDIIGHRIMSIYEDPQRNDKSKSSIYVIGERAPQIAPY